MITRNHFGHSVLITLKILFFRVCMVKAFFLLYCLKKTSICMVLAKLVLFTKSFTRRIFRTKGHCQSNLYALTVMATRNGYCLSVIITARQRNFSDWNWQNLQQTGFRINLLNDYVWVKKWAQFIVNNYTYHYRATTLRNCNESFFRHYVIVMAVLQCH